MSDLDPRQTRTDTFEAQHAHFDGRQAQLHTAMPGHIVSYNATTMTAVVQPALQGVRVLKDGTRKMVDISPIHDVPVSFPGGGGHTITFPVAKGDECMIVFQERSIDNWHQHGGTQAPSDWRMHDINDAIVHVGLRSQSKVPSGVDPDTVQIRSDDKKTLIQIDGKNNAIILYANGASEALVFVDGKTEEVIVHAKNVQIGQAGGNLGVLGATPVPRPTITGSFGGVPALKALLQFLQLRGDIIDGST